jgi:biotin transport system permease protein
LVPRGTDSVNRKPKAGYRWLPKALRVISLYRPGVSLLHKTPVGWKLLGLMLVLIAISIWGRTLLGSIAIAAGFLVLFALTGFGVGELLRQLWQLRFILVILTLPQLLFAGVERGTYNTVALVSGIMLAGLVTLTTKTAEIVELIQRITRSRSFALLIALSINSIGIVLGLAKNISEAGKARGVRANPVRQIVTLFVLSLKFADDYAESLAARGISV